MAAANNPLARRVKLQAHPEVVAAALGCQPGVRVADIKYDLLLDQVTVVVTGPNFDAIPVFTEPPFLASVQEELDDRANQLVQG